MMNSDKLESITQKKVAFTLAEVLITLGIIGVVAALVLPPVMKKINETVKLNRMENIHQKLSKVTDKMASLDVLQGQDSTHNFVYEMKKHMNIAKICENNEIAACWPTSKVDLGDGNSFDISSAKTGGSLKATDDDKHEWDNTMAIVTADGTSMIISYNKKCSFDANTSGLHYDNNTGTSTSLTSGCLAVVYDWNGGSRPNKISEDVQFLGGAGGLGNTCAYKLGNLCIKEKAHVPNPLTYNECVAKADDLGITSCCGSSECMEKGDYWAGAVDECGGVDNMVSLDDLAQIAAYLLGKTSVDPTKVTPGPINLDRANELGLTFNMTTSSAKSFGIYANEPSSASEAKLRTFLCLTPTNCMSGIVSNLPRSSNQFYVMCKGN